jgi:GTP 3',8-cyclase
MTDVSRIIPITATTTRAVAGVPRSEEPFIADTLLRPLRDLRISVTGRCNLRCTYCMPREVFDQHHVFLPRAGLLSFEEIERLVRSFIGLGVQKICLTGGEPHLCSFAGCCKKTTHSAVSLALPQLLWIMRP